MFSCPLALSGGCRFGKEYATVEEETLRLGVFRDNWRLISEHNAADRPYKLGVNGELPLQLLSPGSLLNAREGNVSLPLPAGSDPAMNEAMCLLNWTMERAFVELKNSPEI